MYDVEATVTETSPTVLTLTADWPVDWLREPGIRTMEILRELLHGEILELPSVPTERAEINGNRGNWRKLQVGNRVLVRCFFPGEREPKIRLRKSHLPGRRIVIKVDRRNFKATWRPYMIGGEPDWFPLLDDNLKASEETG